MATESDLYSRYTSTSALASGYAEEDALAWTKGYFRAHYARHLPANKDAAILEVGCGYGGNLAALAEMGYRQCYGIDLSAEQVAHAKSALGLSNVAQANALDWLNDKTAVFDCILVIDVLEHLGLDELLELGRRIRQALKPGGSVIVQVPNGTTLINPYLYGDLTHVRAFTPQSLRQFFLLVGLTPEGYFEVPPHVHGLRSIIRRVLWTGIVKPLTACLMSVVKGRVVGGHVYTLNLIAVATNNRVDAVHSDGD